jgi:hypothetical protein
MSDRRVNRFPPLSTLWDRCETSREIDSWPLAREPSAVSDSFRCPTRTTSFGPTTHLLIRLPLTNVPLLLCRSSTSHPSGRAVTKAWCHETEGSLSLIAASEARPTNMEPPGAPTLGACSTEPSPPARATLRTDRPIATVSPWARDASRPGVRRSSLTQVPLDEPRSTILMEPESQMIRACSHEACWSASWTSASDERPISAVRPLNWISCSRPSPSVHLMWTEGDGGF